MRPAALAVAVFVSSVGLSLSSGSLVAREQAPRPRVSPRAELTAEIDGVTIAMEYGRPSKRGRDIWGSLVPWTRWWMPGADETTSFVTGGGALMVGTLRVPEGAHTIYTQPGPDVFLLIVNRQTGQFHTVYRPDMDLGRVPMAMATLPDEVEQLTFAVDAPPAGGGTLTLSWDDRAYSVPLAAAPREP